MSEKKLFLTADLLKEIINTYPTPFHLYDEKAILENARSINNAFSKIHGFKEYFAVKANPNPYFLKMLKNENFGADCSSMPELLISEKVGVIGENIMFSSNDTPEEEFIKAKELGAIINLDDISHIGYLNDLCKMPELICFRYNPGSERRGNVIIGKPEEAKFGFTKEQLFKGYKMAAELGAKRFGLHTMVISNELDSQYIIDTADMLFDMTIELRKELGIKLEFINIGGGIGIPYKPRDKKVPLDRVAEGIKELYDKKIENSELSPLKIYMECGRMITGPYGVLITKIRHIKNIYKKYAGCDACMANLMRPGIYGAYHHITVLGKENEPADQVYDITGSLCENNDKFAIDRKMPQLERDDILVIHDAGAHGHAMGFNYNGKLRSAEILLREKGDYIKIRRAETVDDYLATVDFDKLDNFNVK